MLNNIFVVGMGGFIGAALRYITSGFVQRLTIHTQFPYGTFAVNIIGSLLIGILAGLTDSRDMFSGTSRAFLFTGILGAFTTFSTFSYETMGLFQTGQTSPAFTNMGLQVIMGLFSVWFGYNLTRWLS